jgi:hypothetical protein
MTPAKLLAAIEADPLQLNALRAAARRLGVPFDAVLDVLRVAVGTAPMPASTVAAPWETERPGNAA